MAFAAVAYLFVLDPTTTRISGSRHPDALAVLLALTTCLPLVVRRRYPHAVLVTTGFATTALSLLHYFPSTNGLGVLLALYTIGTSVPTRDSVTSVLVTEVFVGVSVINTPEVHARAGEWRTVVGIVVANLSIFCAVWLAGRYMRTRRAYIAEVEARAAQSDRERVAQTRAAIAEERERIAREMHDVVAHHVTVMVVSASAARRTMARDPAQVDGILATVEASGRAALTEMRRIVGYLRDESGELDRAPLTGLADIDAVVRGVCDAGVPVDVHVVGDPVELPVTIDATAYRVVQEALTNVLKHAAPASARVTIRYDTDALTISVIDDGAPHALPGRAPGHGLVGMRERVTLVGGSLRAGPLPSGGFDVHARLPLSAAKR